MREKGGRRGGERVDTEFTLVRPAEAPGRVPHALAHADLFLL